MFYLSQLTTTKSRTRSRNLYTLSGIYINFKGIIYEQYIDDIDNILWMICQCMFVCIVHTYMLMYIYVYVKILLIYEEVSTTELLARLCMEGLIFTLPCTSVTNIL